MAGATKVRCSVPIILYTALLWLILPLGWPTIFLIGMLVAQFAGAFDDPAAAATAMGLLAIPVAALWWAWWRYAGVRARPLSGGLLVRGMWRTYRVPWSDVLDVGSTEFTGQGRAFNFSWTIVAIRVPDGAHKEVRVSRSYRHGIAGQHRIQSWAPEGHPVHRPLSREATRRKSTVDETVLATVPVSRTIRVAARVAFGLLIVVTLFWGYRFSQRFDSMLPAGGMVLLAAALLWPAVRFGQARVELTRTWLVSHGPFGTTRYGYEEIEGFTTATAPLGQYLRVVLVGRGTRYIAAAGGGEDHVAARHILEQWRRELD